LGITKDNHPFFILGRERSGTTMLRVCLNNHSQINIPPESPFIIHLFKKYSGKKNIDLDQFLIDLKREPFIQIWKINYEDLTKQLHNASPQTFPNYCKMILSHYHNKPGLLGDKNPLNSLFGIQLKTVFPNAKFIWIIRDYRAQVNSMLKVNFEKKIISSLAKRWVDYNKEIESLHLIYPNQTLLIKYEDLVKSPEKKYQAICNFLEIQYEPSVLTTEKHKNEFYPKHHVSLDEQINTKHIDEWKNQFTKKQIKICETVAGKYGEKFGYEKSLSQNSISLLSVFLGVLYGRYYIIFIKLMYSLPINIRMFINQKVIYKHSTFWKEIKNHYD
jgi:hypothetical protein